MMLRTLAAVTVVAVSMEVPSIQKLKENKCIRVLLSLGTRLACRMFEVYDTAWFLKFLDGHSAGI